MKKGFTLIELLGVIVILALLAILVFPSIINSIKNSSDETDDLTLDLIYNAADLYITNHIDDFPKTMGNKYIINLSDLVSEGHLVSPIKLSGSNTDITHTKCLQVSYNGNYKYELKNSGTCEEVKKLCTVVSGTGNGVGDEISCAGENFYVISNDGTNVEMLAKYNLDVGSISSGGVTSSITNPTGIQKEVAIGYKQSATLWYGTVQFSDGNYWYNTDTSSYIVDYSTSGRDKPYVYTNNSLGTVYFFVENYVTYLKNKGIDASAKLLSYEQAIDLGCTGATVYTDGNCSSSPSFVYATSYWLGSAEGTQIYMIGTTEAMGLRTYNAYTSYGARPVVTMSVDYLK